MVYIDVQCQGIVTQAFYLGDASQFNTSRDDCLWKRGSDRDTCPDKDIRMILYTSHPNSKRYVVRVFFSIRSTDI